MSLFTFIFLSCEFLFVDIISLTTKGINVVNAQNYVLGSSVLGFFLYSFIDKQKSIYIVTCILSLISFIFVNNLDTYISILISGLMLFLFLGILGGASYYKSICDSATVVGVSYMCGTLLQFVVNYLSIKIYIIPLCLVLLSICLFKTNVDEMILVKKDTKELSIILILLVSLLTIVFSTLDNAVTIYHANKVLDIGRWPRLLLAFSALLAGFLYDIRSRKYMSIIIYCVMVLSTICLLVNELLGLIIFYLSVGFFAVFFTSTFLELAPYTNRPKLYAGMGRAINNLVAILISNLSLNLLSSGNKLLIISIELILFVFTNILTFVYTNKYKLFIESSDNQVKEYNLTPREREVLNLLISSDDKLQEIADKLSISKRTLERYVTSIYKKTNTTSRVGLISLFKK